MVTILTLLGLTGMVTGFSFLTHYEAMEAVPFASNLMTREVGFVSVALGYFVTVVGLGNAGLFDQARGGNK